MSSTAWTVEFIHFVNSSQVRLEALVGRIWAPGHMFDSPDFDSSDLRLTTCTSVIMTDPECWTDWFDRDDPAGDSGDWETLKDLRKENPGGVCDIPLQIEVRTTAGLSVASTGNVISVSDTTTGFICKNSDQETGMCYDYRVRFLCPPDFCRPKVCWTEWFDRDDPTASGDWELLSDLRKKFPEDICEKPLGIEVVTVDTNIPVASTGQATYIYSPTVGFVCRNQDQSCHQCFDYKVRFGCPCPCDD
uniref:WxxW domain-containing protein n=1 Tax=Sphaeramia orbicularis TaxID=375764 RepID=A0A673BV57_9TELE